MSAYCDSAANDPLHRDYHDHEYGFPIADDAALFERLTLEIFQAGLTWRLILQRRPALQRAFAGFDPAKVAAFDLAVVEALLADRTIIRNRRKIEATIHNAAVIRDLRQQAGGFDAWLRQHHPRSEAEWVRLFKATFRFMGPEIVREFLLSLGFLPGAHREDCPVQVRIRALDPPWLAHCPEAMPVATPPEVP